MNDFRDLLPHVPLALLVIFRIGGIALTSPVFSSPSIPVKIRVPLAFLLGLAVYPMLSSGAIEAAGGPPKLELFVLAPLVAAELAIGMILGFLASIPLLAVQTGGLVMGQQMGLGFARLYNPGIDDEADLLGQLLFFMALTGFLMSGGLEVLVLAILHSFERIALGSFAIDLDVAALVTGLLLSSLELALRVAAPVLTLIFLQSVTLGFLAKTVPQLNILSLGFPVRILVGTATVFVVLHILGDVVLDQINEVVDVIFLWLDGTPVRAA